MSATASEFVLNPIVAGQPSVGCFRVSSKVLLIVKVLESDDRMAPFRVNDELLAAAGNINENNILVLVTATIPGDLTQMSVNLQGPFVINVEEHKACQIIVENGDYPVKFPIYEILQARKAGE